MPIDLRKALRNAEGFEWDEGNVTKNWEKHRVSTIEAESVFEDRHRRYARDVRHSTDREERFVVYGTTLPSRALVVVFTFRNNRIRVISTRDMNRKERTAYGRTKKT